MKLREHSCRSGRVRLAAALVAAGVAFMIGTGGSAGLAGAAPRPAPEAPGAPPAGRFPTPERLEDLTRTPLPEGVFDRPVAVVDDWILSGPFPDVIGAVSYRDPSDWGALLETAAARRAGLVVATEAMHCAAREWGLFFLEKGAPPGPHLQSFLAARCSAVAPQVAYHQFEGGVPADASDAEIFESWRDVVDGLLEGRLVGGPLTAGIWFGRKDGRALVVIAAGERLVRVDPVPTVFEQGDGTFFVSGELLVEAVEVSAAVNVGEFDASDCERRLDLALPRFAFRCKVDRRDATSWLTVSLTPPGRVLGRGALGAVLWPSGQPSLSWQRPSRGDPAPVTAETDVPGELLTRVNRIRAQAGRGPLEMSAAQSAVATRLAPHYFASLFGVTPPQGGDLVVLGLLAGWNVEGLVQDGHFASSWVTRSNDLDQLLSAALQYPSGRMALLDPEAKRLAVGTVIQGDGAFLAGIFGTYSLFEEDSHDAAAARVLEALDAARAAAGKPRVRHLVRVTPLSRLSARRVQGGEEPKTVLGDLLRQSAEVLHRSVNGWLISTSDPSDVTFPTALLERDVLEIAIGVSHHKPEGEAWGSYVILVVAAEPEGQGA
jgi:hypothetical protein